MKKILLLLLCVSLSAARAEIPKNTLVQAKTDTFACKSIALTIKTHQFAERKEAAALAVMAASQRCAKIYKDTKLNAHEQNGDILILTFDGLGDDDFLYGLADRFRDLKK